MKQRGMNVRWSVVVVVAALVAAAGASGVCARGAAAGARGSLGADDALLEALAGARGRNRLAVCAPAPAAARCPAVAWRRHWALLRASCLAAARAPELPALRVFRTSRHDWTCDSYERAPREMEARARRALGAQAHPMWTVAPRYDAALLRLAPPLPGAEPPANLSAADHQLQSILYWMERVSSSEAAAGAEPRSEPGGAPPLLLTGVLPCALFLAVFLLVTFGLSRPVKVPYANVGDGIVTPWMRPDYYASDVKCYPTYGKV